MPHTVLLVPKKGDPRNLLQGQIWVQVHSDQWTPYRNSLRTSKQPRALVLAANKTPIEASIKHLLSVWRPPGGGNMNYVISLWLEKLPAGSAWLPGTVLILNEHGQTINFKEVG